MVSALGYNVGENLYSLRRNRSGIAPLRYLQTSHTEFPVGEVKMTNEEMMFLLDISENEPTTRTALMGMLAIREALQTANLWKIGNLRIAFINGTTVGGMDKSEQFYIDFIENDTKNAYISTHDCGACTEMIADYFGIFSQVDTISTACSSAANAIVLGAELLKSGRADIVVAGGSECITKFHLNGFNTLMILDREPCRPFDATRAGLNLGEGAAYIVMETAECFQKRKANFPPLCELKGYANTCDAFHQTASSPDGEGAYLAMKKAIEDAQLTVEQIDYINAHGTGTTNNDLSEGTAIMRLFGENIPLVSSTKSFTGHTTSAAGGVEAVISILALQQNFIPANLNFSAQMPELPFAPATNQQPTKPLQHILSNSFGFGGNDTSLIFSKTN
jgi:3-oxoacyl-(acyl-carrier-protein) synthase